MFGDFKIIKKCKTTNARVSTFELANNTVHLPVYMPVATYGAMRAVPVSDLSEEIILANTYHLRSLNRNVKEFMGWKRSILTDSGGFQIQSLPDVRVVDDGVIFEGKLFTPEDSLDVQMVLGGDIMMQLDDVVNPMMDEKLHVKAVARSIDWLDRAIRHVNKVNREKMKKDYEKDDQMIVNGKEDNIVDNIKNGEEDNMDNIKNGDEDNMDNIKNGEEDNIENGEEDNMDNIKNGEEDNIVDNIENGEEEELEINESRKKIKLNETSKIRNNNCGGAIEFIQCHNNQVIFPIIQGGLLDHTRLESIRQILRRRPKGLAIGGLSGGEDKNDFCRTVHFCCSNLPDGLPRYLMGVGYPEDIVVCCALGTDMSDCVYPTRTARFGRAFSDEGDVQITNNMMDDIQGIVPGCGCPTCGRYSRSYLALIKGTPFFCMLLSRHNLYYMRGLTQRIRQAVMNDRYPEFIKKYMETRFKSNNNIPEWIVNALKLVNVNL